MRIIEELLARHDFKEGDCWQQKHFPAGAKIVELGETSKTVFLLRKGAARVLGTVEVSAKKRIHPGVCELTSGDIFGELALFDDEPRSASVVAIESCDVILIEGDHLIAFLETHSDIGFAFMQELMGLMVDRLRTTNNKVFSLLAWGLKAHQIDEHLD